MQRIRAAPNNDHIREVVSPWEEITSFDETLPVIETLAIGELENQRLRAESDLPPTCPYLRRTGSYFFYCGARVDGEPDPTDICPSNQVYTSHVDTISLQLFCWRDYGKCIFFKEREKS